MDALVEGETGVEDHAPAGAEPRLDAAQRLGRNLWRAFQQQGHRTQPPPHDRDLDLVHVHDHDHDHVHGLVDRPHDRNLGQKFLKTTLHFPRSPLIPFLSRWAVPKEVGEQTDPNA